MSKRIQMGADDSGNVIYGEMVAALGTLAVWRGGDRFAVKMGGGNYHHFSREEYEAFVRLLDEARR